MTGYSAEEMTPDLWDQLIERTIPIGDAAGMLFSEATTKARLGQIPIWRCDYLIRTAGGSSRWIADTALEQMGPDGKSRGSIGILQDITDRKLAETALKESEQRFRAILDTVPDIIAEVDINKVFTWVNQAGRQFFGDPVIGSSAVSYFEAEKNFYERVQPLFDGESDDFYLESWHSRQDGEKRLLAWWGRSIVDADGIITGALFSARDITENKLAEAAVRQAEEKYRTIFENTLVGTYWSTPQGRYIIVNPAYAKILGYDSPELLMQEIQDIGAQLYVDPTERAKLLQLLDRDGELNGYETRIFRKDGKVVDVRFDDSVVRDPDGRILYYQGTVLDITDRKRAESALQESEQRFRAIFENSATSIALSDSDWMILTANPSFQDLFGYEINELQQMQMGQLSHPDDLPEEKENVQRMVAGEIDSFQLEKRYLRKDCSIFWGRTIGSLIRDESGEPRYGLMLINDITDQKRAIEGLRERDAILQSVAFEAEALMKAADWRESIDLFLEMLGKETGSSHVYVYRTHTSQDGQMYFTMDHEWTAPSEISDLDNPFFLAVPLEHIGGKYWLAAVLNGEPYYGSLSSMPPEEIEVLKFYDLKATLDVPINVGNSFWGFIGFDDVKNDRAWSEAEVDSLKAAAGILSAAIQRQMNDEAIRQLNAELEQRVRLRTSELENANSELESFAYSVSHDLRTPLRGIDGYSRLLLDEFGSLLDRQGREYLENVRKATSQMGQLIDDLLKLSRVTRLEMHYELFDLSGKANELVAELCHQHPDRNVQITVQPDLVAFGDTNLLRLVLENLLSNAWKFTSQNPKAKIKIGKIVQDGQTVFFVRDNGVGFDMKYSHKLFVAFQRLHSVDDFEGTGVGLATVYRIIQRHSGRIWADAKVGQGATFYFMLPGPEEGSD